MVLTVQVQHVAGMELKIDKCKNWKIGLMLQVQHIAGVELKIERIDK